MKCASLRPMWPEVASDGQLMDNISTGQFQHSSTYLVLIFWNFWCTTFQHSSEYFRLIFWNSQLVVSENFFIFVCELLIYRETTSLKRWAAEILDRKEVSRCASHFWTGERPKFLTGLIKEVGRCASLLLEIHQLQSLYLYSVKNSQSSDSYYENTHYTINTHYTKAFSGWRKEQA